jgi:hypothetical protein
MGGAFTAVADDVNCVYYNPAGLTGLETREETYLYAERLDVLKLHYIGLAQKNIGFYFIYMGAELESGRASASKSEMNHMSEMLIGLSFGKKIFPTVSVGGSLTFPILRTSTESEDRWGIGLDLGCLYQVHPRIMFGASVKDIAARVQGEALFPKALIGAKVNVMEEITFSADVFNKEDYKDDNVRVGFRLGGEYVWRDMLALRCGVDDGNFTAGIGFMQDRWQIDCALGVLKKDLLEKQTALYVSATLRL